VRINYADKKPFLTVALKSNKLDFKDLGVVSVSRSAPEQAMR